MITSNEVLTKLQTFLDYSKSQKPEFEAQYTALMNPLIDAVNTYFSTEPKGMKEALENYVHQSFCDTFTRKVKYENPVSVDLPTDYPTGYDDIRLCFYTFPLLQVTPEVFHAAWVEGVPETPTADGGGTTGTPEPLNNTLLDQWLPEVTKAPTDDVERVKTLNDWFINAGGSVNMVNLLEDQGVIISAPDTQETARLIYIEHHLLEVIKTRNFNVYIPTYLKG